MKDKFSVDIIRVKLTKMFISHDAFEKLLDDRKYSEIEDIFFQSIDVKIFLW